MGQDWEMKPTAAHRALVVLIELKGHSLIGMSNIELSKKLGYTPVEITRALGVLQDVGLVSKLKTGRFVHSVTMLEIAKAHADHIEDAEARINELKKSIAAGKKS